MPRLKRTHRPLGHRSRLVTIVSDIHFDLHHEPTWQAYRKFHKHVQPWMTIVLGDFVDLGMMSRYVQEPDAQVHAIPQIRTFVKEANAIFEDTTQLIVMDGNHDERWYKYVYGMTPHALRDAVGLSLKEQCRFQGLNEDIKWVTEGRGSPGIRVGQFLLRHGHKQSGRFGGGKHLAANRISKSLGTSEVFGHHHRIQLHAQTAQGKTAIAIANPCMTGDHDYAADPDWQRGFTILELNSPKFDHATPHPILIENGRFSWGGWTYDGNK